MKGVSAGKVPGAVPPARVYFLSSSLSKGILFGNFSDVVWARVCFLAILFKEMPTFGKSCKETKISKNFGPEDAKFDKFCLENANSWHF